MTSSAPAQVSIRCAPGSEKEVIALLLEEYRQLRTEIGNRFTTRSQVLSLVSVAVAVVLASGVLPGARWPSVGLLVLIGYGWWFLANRNAVQVAKRIRRLEIEIDALAQQAYGVSVPPLRWEVTAFRRRATSGPVLRFLLAAMGWGGEKIDAPADPRWTAGS